MSINRYNTGSDFYGFDVLDRMMNFSSPAFSYLKGEFYDPDKFDLIPKKSYKEKQLRDKEKYLSSLKERHENYYRQYKEQVKTIELEIEQLRQQIEK
jgi:hypothetical protein